jgi:hypothetical protein
MAQAFSHWPLNAEVQVRARASPCGFVVEKVALGQAPSASVFRCQCHFTMALHARMSSGGRTIGPLAATV